MNTGFRQSSVVSRHAFIIVLALASTVVLPGCDYLPFGYTPIKEITAAPGQFEGKEGPVTVAVHGRYRADNSEAVREGVLAGLGIAVIPAFAFGNEIAERLVKVLLADHEPRRLPMHAVYPSRRFVPLKVRALIDFLAHEFEIDPALSGYGASQSQ